jgi:5'-nucleotidase / UDP-sugar diphosphatase
MKTIRTILLFLLVFISACSKDNEHNEATKNLTIFFVNDVHGQIDNFPKVKHIIDAEREITNVIVAASGDMFSGNPVVDNHPEKGYPLIDIMNQIGFDISVLGNHEFDYGVSVLKDRIAQSDFEWICANVDMGNTEVPQANPYATISVGDLKVTFLGLVETGGKPGAVIPSTHPWKVQDLTFERAENVLSNYIHTKETEDADLFIALSHLGYNGYEDNIGDVQLAQQNYFFDLIIGGHTHAIINETISNIPIFQSGSYLNNLGKIKLSVKNKSIQTINFELIELENYSEFVTELKAIIDDYNDLPYLQEVIGYSHQFHERYQVGCFYTDAMRLQMNVDVAFQNTGGVRSALDQGDITIREIYEIEPFNNGTVIYEMTVEQIKQFLKGTGSGFYYSGLIIRKNGDNIQINDLHNREIPDDYKLTVGINDYIPAVHNFYFPDNGVIQTLSAAKTLIEYLKNINGEVDYTYCNQYFRY